MHLLSLLTTIQTSDWVVFCGETAGKPRWWEQWQGENGATLWESKGDGKGCPLGATFHFQGAAEPLD